jgi:Protein of unknown function (DUF1236)
MKSKFLIATAVAALMTGTVLSAAQAAQDNKHNTPAARAPAARPAPAARAPAPRAPVARAPVVRAPPAAARAPTVRAPVARAHEPAVVNRQAQRANERGNRIERNANRGNHNERNADRDHRNITTGTVQSQRPLRGEDRSRDNRSTEIERSHRGKAVSLTGDQRSRIRETILRQHNAPRAARADFDIRVGGRIPRDRLRFVDLEPLPTTIVDIEPEWQGYLYFLVGDEIVVVDPDSLEIVAVLPA